MKGGYTILDFGGVTLPATGSVFVGLDWVKKCAQAIKAGKPVLVQNLFMGNASARSPISPAMGTISATSNQLYHIYIPVTGSTITININPTGYMTIGK